MSERQYWIGVVSKDHVDAAIAGSFAQLNHGKAGPLERMRQIVAVDAWPDYEAILRSGPTVLVSAHVGNFEPFGGYLAFGITLWILWKLAFPRIGEALDRRQKAIEESIDTVERTALGEGDQAIPIARPRIDPESGSKVPCVDPVNEPQAREERLFHPRLGPKRLALEGGRLS